MKLFLTSLLALTAVSTAAPEVATKQLKVGEKIIKLTITSHPENFKNAGPYIKLFTTSYFQQWQQIAQFIDAPIDKTPTHLTLKFKQKMGHPAHVAGKKMVMEMAHLEKDPGDASGVFTHELTHFVQSYPAGKAPWWFQEGSADYVRYKLHPKSAWAKRNSKHTDKTKPLGGYWNSTAFLLWMEATYQKKIVATVSRAIKDGTYQKPIWKQLTGKTLTELTTLYKTSGTSTR